MKNISLPAQNRHQKILVLLRASPRPWRSPGQNLPFVASPRLPLAHPRSIPGPFDAPDSARAAPLSHPGPPVGGDRVCEESGGSVHRNFCLTCIQATFRDRFPNPLPISLTTLRSSLSLPTRSLRCRDAGQAPLSVRPLPRAPQSGPFGRRL